MVEVIEDLLANLEAAPLTLEAPGVEEARELRTRLVAQVRNHLIPRLREVAAPVIVVIGGSTGARSEEHTSELQSRGHLVCRLLLEKKKNTDQQTTTHV